MLPFSSSNNHPNHQTDLFKNYSFKNTSDNSADQGSKRQGYYTYQKFSFPTTPYLLQQVIFTFIFIQRSNIPHSNDQLMVIQAVCVHHDERFQSMNANQIIHRVILLKYYHRQ